MAWYHIPGNEQDTVISTCVCIGRNIAAYPFTPHLNAPKARELLTTVGQILETNGFRKFDCTDISHTAAYALVEQQYTDPSFIRQSLPHALFLNEPCNLSVSVCASDHMQIRCLMPALGLRDAHEGIRKVDAVLDESLDMAFDPELGFLSPDLNSLGTAMKATVILALPLLKEWHRTESLAYRLDALGFHFRPVYREGTGSLFSLSNRFTLGLCEEEILSSVESAARVLIGQERDLRSDMKGEALECLSDRIYRSVGILRFARRLSAEEVVTRLTDIRLGVSMGLFTDIRNEEITASLVESMPSLLAQSCHPAPVNMRENNQKRAELIRSRFSRKEADLPPQAVGGGEEKESP